MHEEKMPEIAGVFCEVMEKQAFLFPEALESRLVSLDEDRFLASSMTFMGNIRGGLLLAVPERTAWELSANFLGMEADDPFVRESSRDSLGEILNITCGHMLTTLFGVGELFDLSIPTPLSLTGPEIALLARKQGSMVFQVDDCPVLLQATFCRPSQAQA
jgi:CheY-specific phosphatase CheX